MGALHFKNPPLDLAGLRTILDSLGDARVECREFVPLGPSRNRVDLDRGRDGEAVGVRDGVDDAH